MSTLFLLLSTFTFWMHSGQEGMMDPPVIWPVDHSKVYSCAGFGYHTHPELKISKFHAGLDIIAEEGEEVVATQSATVIEATYSQRNGYYILLQHDDSYQTRYLHLSKLCVEQGQKVEKGEKIGEVGSTGMTTAPHLHYEVIKDGEKVDPMGYLQA